MKLFSSKNLKQNKFFDEGAYFFFAYFFRLLAH
jgi:hypothetical protein